MRKLPELGVGVSFRPAWRKEVLARVHANEMQCLEVIAEHYIDCPPEKSEELVQLRTQFPLIPHGIGLSIGTDAPLERDHLRKLASLVESAEAVWFSEHIAFTQMHGWNIGHLAPLPFTHEAIDVVCHNITECQSALGVTLLMENITYVVAMPGEMTEAEFLSEIVERTGCGLLLDLHNVHTNALNHKFDAISFLDSLPLQHVGQIHVGGGHDEEGYRVDSHSGPTPEPVWDLLRYIAQRTQVNAVIVEWDVKLPPFSVVLQEVQTAQRIIQGDSVAAA